MVSLYDCMMHEKLLHKEYIKGPILDLKLKVFCVRDAIDSLPSYHFDILLAGIPIGMIALRLGYDDMTMIHGHIGYSIKKEYQGHGYSYYALDMIKNLAKEHGYSRLIVTAEPTNLRSIKVVLKSGGRLLFEQHDVPQSHTYYVLGIKVLNVYEILL
ncbi:MAG: GNAT family N-acetyltransferase [Acholeplasma sp.]|nr:MAG: GNAT family N-acetyltransferase [Acholeplasma sp.]